MYSKANLNITVIVLVFFNIIQMLDHENTSDFFNVSNFNPILHSS